MERMPLEDALALTTPEPGTYVFEFPPSVCFGLVTLGGLLVSASCKACKHFMPQCAQITTKPDLLQSSVRFTRPVLASPNNICAKISCLSTSKVFATLSVEIFQNQDLCMIGHFTFTDMSVSGPVSASTGWKLSPAPLRTTIDLLQEDEDPHWVSYCTPMVHRSVRNAQAYMKFYIPVERQHTNYIDQWVTPGWEDSKRPQGAVWTNDLIHFVMDNHFPYWSNYVSKDTLAYCRYEDLVTAALAQRKARKDGRDEMIFGDHCGPFGPLQWISTSVASSVQIKKLLPQEGTKWLFMRTYSCKLDNNRLDEQIYLMDMYGDLIALAMDAMHVVPGMSKMENRRSKA